eukprot:TRINITY_DN3013_c0_g2_i2.p1 TRINITY_DN3013_c0_g2~~TRINITY_DN3013_c0_g2_i2.p1  ORF type:complete len:101 (-),score=26.45 TRINITY_DN3013_c0_g2_i2:10-312(-)
MYTTREDLKKNPSFGYDVMYLIFNSPMDEHKFTKRYSATAIKKIDTILYELKEASQKQDPKSKQKDEGDVIGGVSTTRCNKIHQVGQALLKHLNNEDDFS